jgi:hypothetical protein
MRENTALKSTDIICTGVSNGKKGQTCFIFGAVEHFFKNVTLINDYE